jgi:hypothetical protein
LQRLMPHPQFCAAWSTVAAALGAALVGVLLSMSSSPPTMRSATPPTSAVRLQDNTRQQGTVQVMLDSS